MGGFVIAALALGSVAAADGLAHQQFAIPGKGSLSLDVPAAWRVRSSPLEQPPSVALTIHPAAGDDFELEVTSVWMDAKARVDPDRLKEVVRQTLNQALPHAVETEAQLVELQGKKTAGYWFSVTQRKSSNTDRDHKYVTQGAAATGPVVSMFTLLSRSADPADRDRALAVLASAIWSDTPLVDARKPQSESIDIEDSGETLRVTAPASGIVMLLPRAGLRKVAGLERPGYFHFTDQARRLVVSGWFEPAERFRGVETFWEDERRNPALKDPQDVTFTKVGNWDAILYDLRVGDARLTMSHVRAHLVANGTWIDVHLSTIGKPPGARARLVKLLETFRLEQKE
jgi:hypothetical protein